MSDENLISDQINAIRDKYDPNKNQKILKVNAHCRNSYAYALGHCERCEMCGRRFKNGKLIQEWDGSKVE